MKKAAFLLVLLIGPALSVYAQPRLTLYAHTGLSLPTFPASLTDFYQTGLHLSAGAGLSLARRTEVVVSAHFSRSRLNHNALLNELEVFDVVEVALDGGDYAWFGLTADLKYDIYAQSRIGPYALIGVGVFNSSIDDLVIVEPSGTATRPGSDEIILGLNGGIGFYVPVAPSLRLVLEPRYTLLLTNDQLLFGTDQTRHFLQIRAGIALGPF